MILSTSYRRCKFLIELASDLPLTSHPERHKYAMRSRMLRATFTITGMAVVIKFRIFGLWKLLVGAGKDLRD